MRVYTSHTITPGAVWRAALVRATRGQGIIVSSGARTAFELRGPCDAVNLATLLGLRDDQAQVLLSS